MVSNSMSCPLPFIHLNIKPNKTTTSCWRCLENHGDYSKKSLLEIWHSKEWQDFRQQHINNERPIGCRSCWEMEDAGIKSTRQTAIEQYADVAYILDPPAPKEIEMRFGNLCNLQCRHCSPKYSSQWMTQIKKHKTLHDNMRLFDDMSYDVSINELPDTTVKELKQIAPTLRLIKITGGEPLMHPMHQEMLNSLKGHEQNIELEYNTNLHILNDDIIKSWKKFKRVICRVSIDADEKTFSYMRTNGNIKTLIQNWNDLVTKMQTQIENKQFDLHATCTINVLNVVRIKEILKFFISLGSKLHVSFVQYPRMLDICNLPDFLKNKVINDCKWMIENIDLQDYSHWRFSDKDYLNKCTYQNIENLHKVIKWINKEKNCNFDEQFTKWMYTQDKINNTCLFDIYKEFDYLKEKYYEMA